MAPLQAIVVGMNQSAAHVTLPAQPHSRSEPVGWALVFGVITSLGLAVLTVGLLLMDALAYGFITVLATGASAAPDDGRYGLALVLGVVVSMVGAPALAWVGFGASSRTWPPVVQGLGAAVCAGVVAACALLLTLGIDPVDFVAAL